MKLNDPFGRMAHREEKEYQSLSKTLKKSGVKTVLDAEIVMEKLQTRRTHAIIAVIIILFFVVVVFPKAFAFVVIFAGLALIWVLRTTVNARKYIKRYIEEELSKSDGQQ